MSRSFSTYPSNSSEKNPIPRRINWTPFVCFPFPPPSYLSCAENLTYRRCRVLKIGDSSFQAVSFFLLPYLCSSLVSSLVTVLVLFPHLGQGSLFIFPYLSSVSCEALHLHTFLLRRYPHSADNSETKSEQPASWSLPSRWPFSSLGCEEALTAHVFV